MAFDCRYAAIDHSGKRLKIETANGVIIADRAIVTLPTTVLAGMENLFAPALPGRSKPRATCRSVSTTSCSSRSTAPEEFEKDSRLFGAKDDSKTAAYHIRPFGRAMIEGFFGGSNARELEAAGEGAFSISPLPNYAAFSATTSPSGSSRSTSTIGARIRSHAAPIRMRCRARWTAARRWPRRWTVDCSSPVRPARSTTTRRRTGPIAPASPLPRAGSWCAQALIRHP